MNEKSILEQALLQVQTLEEAVKANAKHLLLGHYSTRYDSIDLFKQEAETIFSNLLLADDGKTFEF